MLKNGIPAARRALPAQRGITLVEVLIGLAIAGLLMALGLPAFQTLLANNKVRNTADAIQAGLQVARAEAIKQNLAVEFLLFGDTDYAPSQAGAVTANTSGPHWLVRVFNAATASYTHIDWRNGFEGSAQSESVGGSVTTTIAATYPTGLTPSNVITFRSLGGTSLGGAATFDVSNPSAGVCNTSSTPGPIRCLRVVVTVAGQVRVCDPSVTSTDMRSC